MATFVLVHGAWHGAWCWRRVTRLLTAHGHEVFAPTLTGVGERAHLLAPAIDLRTHIADVVNLMKWERLDGVVLVGHSYGGMVATWVAEEMGGAIGSIVFLDAFYPESGQSLADQAIKITRDGIEVAERTVSLPVTGPAGSKRVKTKASTNSSSGTPYCRPIEIAMAKLFIRLRKAAPSLCMSMNISPSRPSSYSPVRR